MCSCNKGCHENKCGGGCHQPKCGGGCHENKCGGGCHENKCGGGGGCHENKCITPTPNYVLGRVLECPPPCAPNFSYPSPSCVDPQPYPHPHPRPHCEEIYDIIEYFNNSNKTFSILINEHYKHIVGFFLIFVDSYGNPINLDQATSTLKVEGVYQYNDPVNPGQVSTYYNVISDTQTKYYYTYIQQCQNRLPYNGCIWTLYANSCVPLKLSFNLKTDYAGPINIYINLFLKPLAYPSPILAPVVDECIESDPCETTGHIRWVVSRCCP